MRGHLDVGEADPGRGLGEDRLDLVVGMRLPDLRRTLGRAGDMGAAQRLERGDDVQLRPQGLGETNRL